MKVDKSQIINTIKLSLILGAILGILVFVPYINIAILLITLLMSAPAVMVYMIMDGKLELESVTHSLVVGAISGFSVNITFSAMFSILTVASALWFNYNPNVFLTAMITQSPLWLLVTFIVFIGVLFATTNAFSGVVVYYLINLIRDIYEKKHPKKDDDFKNYIK